MTSWTVSSVDLAAVARRYVKRWRPMVAASLAWLCPVCWFFYSAHLRTECGRLLARGEPGWVPPAERPYPEQKVFAVHNTAEEIEWGRDVLRTVKAGPWTRDHPTTWFL